MSIRPRPYLEAIKEVTSQGVSGPGGGGGDPEEILITALNTWFGSVLACESFHADVHAGNLLVLRDGRVGFIDFGIVGRISPGVWGAVQLFFQATASREYVLMVGFLVFGFGVFFSSLTFSFFCFFFILTHEYSAQLEYLFKMIPQVPGLLNHNDQRFNSMPFFVRGC